MSKAYVGNTREIAAAIVDIGDYIVEKMSPVLGMEPEEWDDINPFEAVAEIYRTLADAAVRLNLDTDDEEASL